MNTTKYKNLSKVISAILSVVMIFSTGMPAFAEESYLTLPTEMVSSVDSGLVGESVTEDQSEKANDIDQSSVSGAENANLGECIGVESEQCTCGTETEQHEVDCPLYSADLDVANMQALLDVLPLPEDADDRESVQEQYIAACKAYDKLTDEQKQQVDTSIFDLLAPFVYSGVENASSLRHNFMASYSMPMTTLRSTPINSLSVVYWNPSIAEYTDPATGITIKGGEDNNSGNHMNSPVLTWAKAASIASSGATIYCMGVFNTGTETSLDGLYKDLTIIRHSSQAGGKVFDINDNLTLSRMTIDGSGNDLNEVIGVAENKTLTIGSGLCLINGAYIRIPASSTTVAGVAFNKTPLNGASYTLALPNTVVDGSMLVDGTAIGKDPQNYLNISVPDDKELYQSNNKLYVRRRAGNTVYLSSTGVDGEDPVLSTIRGLTPENPVKTFVRAKALAESGRFGENTTITICETVTISGDEVWDNASIVRSNNIYELINIPVGNKLTLGDNLVIKDDSSITSIKAVGSLYLSGKTEIGGQINLVGSEDNTTYYPMYFTSKPAKKLLISSKDSSFLDVNNQGAVKKDAGDTSYSIESAIDFLQIVEKNIAFNYDNTHGLLMVSTDKVYVDSVKGTDTATTNGSYKKPYQTLSYALKNMGSATKIAVSSAPMVVSGTIDLGSYTIQPHTDYKGSLIQIESNTTISGTDAKIHGTVEVTQSSTFTMGDGVAISRKDSSSACTKGILVKNGSFIMNGGKITECSTAIEISKDKTATLNGGEISDNTAGGREILAYGSLKLAGTTITNSTIYLADTAGSKPLILENTTAAGKTYTLKYNSAFVGADEANAKTIVQDNVTDSTKFGTPEIGVAWKVDANCLKAYKAAVTYKENSVYVKGFYGGNDANDGTTADKAVETFDRAKALLEAMPDAKGDIIVVNALEHRTVTSEWSLPKGSRLLRYHENAGSEEYNGLIKVVSGTLTLNDITIDGNGTVAQGISAVKVEKSATLNVTDGTVITNNNAAQYAGGVYNLGTLNMSGGKIKDNTAHYGGGIDNRGTMTLSGDAEISGNTVTNSDGGGILNYGTLTMSGGAIKNNTATKGGGGIYNSGPAFSMTDGEISGNTAGCNGGGILNYSDNIYMKEITITGGTISNNSASMGGGIANYIVNGTVTCNIGLVTISGNRASTGGGIGNQAYINFNCEIDGTTISDNSASYAGGGIAIYGSNATVNCTIENAIISNNTAINGGGGIQIEGGETKITNTRIIGNVSTGSNVRFGGGGISNDGTLIINDSTIQNNGSSTYGGGIYIKDKRATATIAQNCIISSNTAVSCGGGVYNAKGTANIVNAEITNNNADGGGGVYNYLGTTNIVNADISNNNALNGGGVNSCMGTTNIESAEIANNTAQKGGGVYNDEFCTLYIKGGTIKGNTATGKGQDLYCRGKNTYLSGAPVIKGEIYAGDNASMLKISGPLTGNEKYKLNLEKFFGGLSVVFPDDKAVTNAAQYINHFTVLAPANLCLVKSGNNIALGHAYYVNGINGNDTNNGSSLEKAFKTLTEAQKSLGVKAGILRVAGTVTVADSTALPALTANQSIVRHDTFKDNILSISIGKNIAISSDTMIDGRGVAGSKASIRHLGANLQVNANLVLTGATGADIELAANGKITAATGKSVASDVAGQKVKIDVAQPSPGRVVMAMANNTEATAQLGNIELFGTCATAYELVVDSADIKLKPKDGITLPGTFTSIDKIANQIKPIDSTATFIAKINGTDVDGTQMKYIVKKGDTDVTSTATIMQYEDYVKITLPVSAMTVGSYTLECTYFKTAKTVSFVLSAFEISYPSGTELIAEESVTANVNETSATLKIYNGYSEQKTPSATLSISGTTPGFVPVLVDSVIKDASPADAMKKFAVDFSATPVSANSTKDSTITLKNSDAISANKYGKILCNLSFGDAIGLVSVNFKTEVTPISILGVDFGSVIYGTTPAEKAIKIQNFSPTESLTINKVALSGTYSDKFSLNKTMGSEVAAGGINTEYTVTPVANINAGTYSTFVTVSYNTGKSKIANVLLTVEKATPPYTVPTGLTATYGGILADVALPTGFTWTDATTTSVGTVGLNSFKAKYTPVDMTNYKEVADISVKVQVNKALLTANYISESIKSGATPALAVGVTGFVNGETALTAAGYAAPTVAFAGNTSTAGIHALNPSRGSATNYTFSYISGTLSISAKINVSANLAVSMNGWIYGGTESTQSTTLSGVAQTTGVTYKYSGTPNGGRAFSEATILPTSTAGKVRAGTYTVTAKFQDATKMGTTTINFTVLAKDVALAKDSLVVTSKPYDGNNIATLTGSPTITGVVSGDTVSTTSGTAIYSSVFVGQDIPVTVTGYTLKGADKENYSLANGEITGLIGKITKEDARNNPDYITSKSVLDTVHIVTNVMPTLTDVKLPANWSFTDDQTVRLAGINGTSSQKFGVKYTSQNSYYADVTLEQAFPVTTVKVGISGGLAVKVINEVGEQATLSPVTIVAVGAPLPNSGDYAQTNMEWVSSCTDIATVAGADLTSATVTSYAKGVSMVGISYKNQGAMLGYVLVKIVEGDRESSNRIEDLNDISDTLGNLVNSTAPTDTDKKAVNAVADEVTRLPAENKAGLTIGNIQKIDELKKIVSPVIIDTSTVESVPKPADVNVVGAAVAGGIKDNSNNDVTSIKIKAIPQAVSGDVKMRLDLGMYLNDASDKTQLKSPIFMGVTIPAGIDLSKLTIKHIKDDNSVENLTFITNERVVSFKLDSFSSVEFIVTSSGGSGRGTKEKPSYNTGADIIVNGKTVKAGTAENSIKDGKTVTTITVDEKKLDQKLETEGNNAVVTIPINTNSDVLIGELNGRIIKNMDNKQSTIEVKSGTAAYTIPAKQIDIDAVSEKLGTNIALKDIKVKIIISKPTQETVKVVENAASAGEFTIIAPPVEFNISCTYDGKTIDVGKFNNYVERTIAIPDGSDSAKITTGVIVDVDGRVRHVPTKITIIDGKYYAKINSLTNSTYAVIWHPIEFKDVIHHWAKDSVNDMGSRMVISGVGNGMFEPDRDITRAEFAAIMVRSLGLKPGTGNNPFMDVKSKDWYCEYIETAYEYGIIYGYDKVKFGPNDKITREQAMNMIARAMKITQLNLDFKVNEIDEILANFADWKQSATWAKYGIADCVDAGIVLGKDAQTIAPKDEITRAEVAAIVRRLLQKSDLI